MLAMSSYVHSAVIGALTGLRGFVSAVAGRARRDEAGQTTAEYALVLLGAAAIALLIVAWATNTDLIGKLFDLVLDKITGKVK